MHIRYLHFWLNKFAIYQEKIRKTWFKKSAVYFVKQSHFTYVLKKQQISGNSQEQCKQCAPLFINLLPVFTGTLWMPWDTLSKRSFQHTFSRLVQNKRILCFLYVVKNELPLEITETASLVLRQSDEKSSEHPLLGTVTRVNDLLEVIQ